jgi:glycosyltransferase involved in cell wall biosynthesis
MTMNESTTELAGKHAAAELLLGRDDEHGAPAETYLLLPTEDVDAPELSIVVPALNEELTISEFVAWCHAGLAKAGVVGEILIIDSSTDNTPQQAMACGARVLRTPKRGLGRAYIDAIPFIRGQYVLLGDADCTYDFRELAPFVERLRGGDEFVMGSRFRGYIEPGSMPPHHRYFGTPLTTWILNRLFSSHFTDIHCGMRALTVDAFKRMDLQSQSWEYASEMVLKSVHLELATGEVPVRFLKDKEGRVSHHRRMGWFSPFQAAWINLRAMFIYGADYFAFTPGIAMLVVGLLVSLLTAVGPVTVGAVTFSLLWKFVGAILAIVGLNMALLGSLSRLFFDYTGRHTRRLLKVFSYTRAMAISGGLFVMGLLLIVPIVRQYIRFHLALTAVGRPSFLAVDGLLLVAGGFSLFVTTLMIHGAAIATGRYKP